MPLVGIWRIQMSKNIFTNNHIDNKHLTFHLAGVVQTKERDIEHSYFSISIVSKEQK